MVNLGDAQFRATSAEYQAFGATPQEALNSLMAMLPADPPAPIVTWPFDRGDAFFTDAQIVRLRELKARRDILTPAEHEELERLVEASFYATISRTKALTPSGVNKRPVFAVLI